MRPPTLFECHSILPSMIMHVSSGRTIKIIGHYVAPWSLPLSLHDSPVFDIGFFNHMGFRCQGGTARTYKELVADFFSMGCCPPYSCQWNFLLAFMGMSSGEVDFFSILA
eukprot:Lithocolla_globosa_v1_NODE_1009_length_2958_cov_13.514296.p4 type:complete len:110 gc:universal NODE_1009_length_2958_cov_13.514296:2111-1782(-)